MTSILAEWYKTYIAIRNYQDIFLSNFSQAKNDDEKAKILLTGELLLKRSNHMLYLWRFPRNRSSRDELLRRIKESKLWATPISPYKNFDALYQFVEGELNNPRIPHIGQLAIYDIALHLTYLNNGNPKPKDYVYVHALPLKACKCLQNNGFLRELNLTSKIPFLSLSQSFPGLTADEFEDLLCQLGKSIRRVGAKNTYIKPKEEEKAKIDAVVNTYIKDFKPIIHETKISSYSSAGILD